MTDLLEEYRSRLRKAMAKLGELESELARARRTEPGPIAIIGMACRFPPAASTPEAFFEMLLQSADAVQEVPRERWAPPGPEAQAAGPDERAARWGAFLSRVDEFDAAFFGISPREARALDPQHRLLLEVAWEALERAGQVPERLARGRVGVFVGMTANDYAEIVRHGAAEAGDIHTITGAAHCFAAGRLSFAFGFQGPSMVVDTACSSSLVALHLACQSLQQGESAVALAGGVSLMLSPFPARLLAHSQALSPDGRCRAFDVGANGFVRGEGCGMIVLKRLADAERDGDPVTAVIRGSAVNQDGRSTGLTVPNVLAQQAMLEQALEAARVAPEEIGYVETHGTGTSLGDPIEFEALRAALGAERQDGAPCFLGAVKTNVGHLEAAAGMAGIIKTALCLEKGLIPPNAHFQSLNPRIILDGTRFAIPTEARAWPSGAAPRIAGVSAFGLSGTNAHLILAEAPRREVERPEAEERSSHLVPLSAKTPEALAALADAVRDALCQGAAGDSALRLDDVAYTAGARRSHHEHRLAVVARSSVELADALAAFSRAEPPAFLAQGRVPLAGPPKVAFVFSGQGSQWAGMGRGLLREEPAFHAEIEACEALVQRHAGFSLLEALAAPEGSSRLDETEVAQPAIFAVQVALAKLLLSWGVAPDAVIGHSVGEIAAAHVAGALSLDDGARLACLRGRAMQGATGKGKMAAVALGRAEAETALSEYEGRLAVAAVNDPGAVVLSGEEAALEAVLDRLARGGVRCRPLHVDYAFHAPGMEPIAEELQRALGDLSLARAVRPMFSTVTGARVEGLELDADHWARGIRDRVLFAPAVEAAIAAGCRLFLEVGPHPVLALNVGHCLDAWAAGEGRAVPTLQRAVDERRAMLLSLAALYADGCAVSWPAIHPSGGAVAPLPTYPWQRRRFWPDRAAEARGRAESSAAPLANPGAKQSLPQEEAGAAALVLEAVRERALVAGEESERCEWQRAVDYATALVQTVAPPPEAETGPRPLALVGRLLEAPPVARRELLAAHVQREVDGVLGVDPSEHAPRQVGFFELGMNSLMAVELAKRLQRALGCALGASALFNHPTIDALVEHLATVALSERPASEAAGRPAHEGGKREPLAADVAGLSEAEMTAFIDQQLSDLMQP